jgi:hypothetical protein
MLAYVNIPDSNTQRLYVTFNGMHILTVMTPFNWKTIQKDSHKTELTYIGLINTQPFLEAVVVICSVCHYFKYKTRNMSIKNILLIIRTVAKQVELDRLNKSYETKYVPIFTKFAV